MEKEPTIEIILGQIFEEKEKRMYYTNHHFLIKEISKQLHIDFKIILKNKPICPYTSIQEKKKQDLILNNRHIGVMYK